MSHNRCLKEIIYIVYLNCLFDSGNIKGIFWDEKIWSDVIGYRGKKLEVRLDSFHCTCMYVGHVQVS